MKSFERSTFCSSLLLWTCCSGHAAPELIAPCAAIPSFPAELAVAADALSAASAAIPSFPAVAAAALSAASAAIPSFPAVAAAALSAASESRQPPAA